MPSPGHATCLPGERYCRGGPARTLGRGDSHRASFVALTLQPASRLQCQCCQRCLPCLLKLRGPVQGFVVLGVLVLGDDKCVFFVVVLLLLLVVSVVAEGCQHPPHNLDTREALKRGPRFVVGHAPLNSEGKSSCCHNAVVRAHPCAAVSASCANFAPGGSSRQGSEQCWFHGARIAILLFPSCLC
jgi:hypothetical protein